MSDFLTNLHADDVAQFLRNIEAEPTPSSLFAYSPISYQIDSNFYQEPLEIKAPENSDYFFMDQGVPDHHFEGKESYRFIYF